MLQFIIFSRKRPLQLHGYLTSLFSHCPEGISVSVLQRVDPEYANAYAQIKDRFPYVHFKDEENFLVDLQGLLDRSGGAYTCFGCDDALTVADIDELAIERLFEAVPNLLGLSLRLGKHILRDMFGRSLEQPVFWPSPHGPWSMWDVSHPQSYGDWAYPWEVLGTVYRAGFVRDMVKSLKAESPSQLEERGSRLWIAHTPLRYMAMWDYGRIVVPTVNLVQTEYPNGIVGGTELSAPFLLECWDNGLRLDTMRYARTAKSQHPESWRIGDFFLTRVA